MPTHARWHPSKLSRYNPALPRVRTVEALQVLERVDLDDVVQAALAHVHVVVVGAVRQGHLVPVALAAPAASIRSSKIRIHRPSST